MADLTKKERRALDLAGLALSAGLAKDWPRATRAVQRLSDECGEGGLDLALQGWADTLIDRMGITRGQAVKIAFMQVDGGDGAWPTGTTAPAGARTRATPTTWPPGLRFWRRSG